MGGLMFPKDPPIAKKVRRALKRRPIVKAEKDHKAEVRRRDKGCRFPLCGCRRFGLALHVSHQKHKGAGGNPKGDRSDPTLMVQVCSARHRENIVSIDRGTLRWRAITRAGANGPIAWDVDRAALRGRHTNEPSWFEVARERWPGMLEPLSAAQAMILTELAEMTR